MGYLSFSTRPLPLTILALRAYLQNTFQVLNRRIPNHVSIGPMLSLGKNPIYSETQPLLYKAACLYPVK
jgi:hypothetical protein